ncbi:MAG: sporulation integral membrane protein YlbJ [Bacillota bacterium]|jgi:sporulation integral membrane protein YlbJ
MKILFSIAAIILCLSMLIFPKETFEAASMGLNTWFTVVFPSLLPFFIMAELFTSLGIVHFISILLEPIMRPLFNLPGSAAFVVSMGYTSGFPIGAALTASLRSQKLCTRLEGERLISFTNNASPLFIFVAVAVGLFRQPTLGIILAIAHYGTNLFIGLVSKYFTRNDPEKLNEQVNKSNLLIRSLEAMFKAQKNDGRPIGKLLGDAVSKSIISLTAIGGFIILFAVIIRLLSLLGVINVLVKILAFIFTPLGFSHDLISAFSTGFFEMTLGAKMASESSAPLQQQIIAASMILAWGGLSVHAQILSMISNTDLRFFPFIIARIAHMILSGLLVMLLFKTQPATFIELPVTTSPTLSGYVLIPFVISLLSLLLPLFIVFFLFILLKTTWLIFRIKR